MVKKSSFTDNSDLLDFLYDDHFLLMEMSKSSTDGFVSFDSVLKVLAIFLLDLLVFLIFVHNLLVNIDLTAPEMKGTTKSSDSRFNFVFYEYLFSKMKFFLDHLNLLGIF